MQRFHVHLGDKRTTVSIDATLAQLLALKLRTQPDSDAAHRVIRDWLQQRLDNDHDPERRSVSQWLQSEIIFHLVDKRLVKRYDDWLLDG